MFDALNLSGIESTADETVADNLSAVLAQLSVIAGESRCHTAKALLAVLADEPEEVAAFHHDTLQSAADSAHPDGEERRILCAAAKALRVTFERI